MSAPRFVLVKTIVRVISRIGEKLDEEIALAARLNEQDLLVDAVGGFRGGRDRNLDRIGQEAARERCDFVRHRRREKQVLPLFRKGSGDPPDGLHKTEVEHAVGLVEDEDFGLGEARGARIEMIFETAGGRDQNVEAARERLDLGAMRHAAEDHGGREAKACRRAQRKLSAIWLANSRVGLKTSTRQPLRGAARLWVAKIMENGKREGGCLAGAGLGDADEVAARQDGRNGLGLDRGGIECSLVWSGHGEAARRGRAGKNQSISVFHKAGACALKEAGSCSLMAAAYAGNPTRRPEEFKGDAPRGWAVERSN